jgi:probable HAF family extracellular repeat protein
MAYGISADGSVVVGAMWYSIYNNEAFRWEGGAGTGLGCLPDPVCVAGLSSSRANAVSADGLVVVGSASWVAISGWRTSAFRWEGGVMTDLGSLGPAGDESESVSWDTSADGSVVVGETNAGAFIWDAIHGMRSLQDVLVSEFGLNLTGWSLDEARGVSNDGRTIVGNGVNPDGQQEAWIAVLPEPIVRRGGRGCDHPGLRSRGRSTGA